MLLHLRKGKDGYNIEVEEISDKRHTSNSNNNNNPSASSGKYVDLAVVPHERIPYIAEVRIGILLLLLSLHLLLRSYRYLESCALEGTEHVYQ